MLKNLIVLFILALAAGWITNLVAGGYQTPLRWTAPLVCGGGEYVFEQVTGRTLDEFGQRQPPRRTWSSPASRAGPRAT